jgi:hypothetical protein
MSRYHNASPRLGSVDGRAVVVIPAEEEIHHILAAATEMTGSRKDAFVWFYRQPIPGWSGKSANDLVREGNADKVLAYLEEVRSGGYS